MPLKSQFTVNGEKSLFERRALLLGMERDVATALATLQAPYRENGLNVLYFQCSFLRVSLELAAA